MSRPAVSDCCVITEAYAACFRKTLRAVAPTSQVPETALRLVKLGAKTEKEAAFTASLWMTHFESDIALLGLNEPS